MHKILMKMVEGGDASAKGANEEAQESNPQVLRPQPQLQAAPKMHGQLGAKIGWRDSSAEKGRGVYALEDILKDTLIETAPVIVVAASAVPEDGGAPDGYLLDWDPDEEGEEHCMPLGYIMLYNHSRNPTLYLENDYEQMTITSFAARDIKAGEELTWDYNCDIWFNEDN